MFTGRHVTAGVPDADASVNRDDDADDDKRLGFNMKMGSVLIYLWLR